MNPESKTLVAAGMDQVSYELSVVIQNGWCWRPPNSYGPGTPLSLLWSQAFPNVPFIPNGAMALIKALHGDHFFGHCPRAFQLTVGMFAPGGAIQTVLDLYFWLQPCQSPASSDVKFSTFLQPASAISEATKQGKKAPGRGARPNKRRGK